MSDSKPHTINLTNAGALTLYSILRDVKWYTDSLDLINAGVISQMIVKKLPEIRTQKSMSEIANFETWRDKAFKFKINESMRETCKKTVTHHLKDGAFVAEPAVLTLIYELGLGSAPNLDGLEDDEPLAAAAAAAG